MIDIDRNVLELARRALGTKTIKDTVNQALQEVAEDHRRRFVDALDEYPTEPIEEFLAWRRTRDTRLG